ncbi:MAG: hypothetical protein M1827_000666 [Pycnora praestabilis]|nr:MAG: hypothetical protein M1827_000666 [Pycnora praestabilis]
MAPKTLPPAAKQALILTWFQESATAHSIRDLEKILPSVASINGMQVKDYLTALSDEGKIRVEKIGSGNWYWSFLSEEKRNREIVLERVRDERDRVLTSVEELRAKVEEVGKARGDGEGGAEEGVAGDRAGLITAQASLLKEVEETKTELATYSESDPTEIERKKVETRELMLEAQRWTDNVLILEGYVLEITGGDRETLERMREEFYGDDYVEGEGLKEIQ